MSQRQWLRVTILVVAIAATAGVFFLGAMLGGGRIAAPIQELSAAATRVSGGDLSVQVLRAAATGDEIGRLGGAFNDMTLKLARAYTDLKAKNNELETALQNLQESRQRLALLEQLKGEMAKFVPESVKKLLEENPNAKELEQHSADVSVLFLDITGYTKLSEQVEARKLNQLVQMYFSSYLEIIQQHRGDISETAGDGLMVIFQSERTADHALNATRTSFAIRQRTLELNEEYGGVFPSIQLQWASTRVRRSSVRRSFRARPAIAGPSRRPDPRPTLRRASPTMRKRVRSSSVLRQRSASRPTSS